MKVVRSSPLRTGRLYPKEFSWYSWHMVPSFSLGNKSPVTPPEFDPETFRLVAQCLNHYATPGPFHLHNIYNLTYIQRLATGWKVHRLNPGEGKIFRTRLDRPWGPTSLLYHGYQVSFPGVKRPGRDVNHSHPSSVKVIDRVELYHHSPSRP